MFKTHEAGGYLQVFGLVLKDIRFLAVEELDENDDDDIITREDLMEFVQLYFQYDDGVMLIAELLFHSGLKNIILDDFRYPDTDIVRVDLNKDEIEVWEIDGDNDLPLLAGSYLEVVYELIADYYDIESLLRVVREELIKQLKYSRLLAIDIIERSYWV